MICVRAIPASKVDLNLSPPSWLRWRKLLEATINWIFSAIAFSINLPRVFRRTIGQKALGLSYDGLFGLGMITVVDTLKYSSQNSKLIQALAILMIFKRHLLFLMIFQWCHDILSGPGAEVSTYFWMVDLNLNLENGFQIWHGLYSISFRMSTLTWRWRAVLKELWRAVHRLSGERQGEPLYLIASVARSFLFLTQFISS